MSHKIDLIQIFKDFLEQEKLQDQKILLMVSGGVDSMVLLDLAQKNLSSEQIIVFHLDHQFRDSAKKDATFVQNICSKLNIQCIVKTLEVKKTKNQESHWRSARKRLSQEAANQYQVSRIITAHHASDLVETMIFRLTKGCGPNGLSPFITGTKPLWKVPKEDLITYAKANQIEWQEDESNTDLNFQRNLIRQKVIPALKKITPNLEKVFIKESILFKQVDDFIQTELQKKCGEDLARKSIMLKKFLELHPLMQKELLRNIAGQTVSQAEINDTLVWLLNEPSGRSQKSLGTHQLHLMHQEIHWY